MSFNLIGMKNRKGNPKTLPYIHIYVRRYNPCMRTYSHTHTQIIYFVSIFYVSICIGTIEVFRFFFLMGWSLLPNALRPFQIYYAPPNLGITRT